MGTSMVEVFRYSLMAIGMRDFMQMENLKEMGHISGKMELFIKANLRMGSDTGMATGHMEVKAMKGITLMTKETDKAYTNGEEAATIRDNLWMT